MKEETFEKWGSLLGVLLAVFGKVRVTRIRNVD